MSCKGFKVMISFFHLEKEKLTATYRAKYKEKEDCNHVDGTFTFMERVRIDPSYYRCLS